MGEPIEFRCVSCGETFAPWTVEYTCPSCGPLKGTLEVLYDYRALGRRLTPKSFAEVHQHSLWRYEELLPLGREHAVNLRAGGTPLYACRTLAVELGLRGLWIKDDSLNPTASCKDRATAVTTAAARKLGRAACSCASTGNAATSLAGFCASAGMPCFIFLPESASRPKIAQLQAFGAVVFAIDGTYDQAFDLCAEASTKFDWFNRSPAVNPMNVEGTKTAALELWEQLGGELPEYVIVPVGDGSVISGLCKAFRELVKVELAEQVPAVFGVQAEGAPAVAQAFARHVRGDPALPAEAAAQTVADSIDVARPRDVVKAVRYVAETGGGFVTVPDPEILEAGQELARRVGVFAEPAAAAAYAGLLRLLDAGDVPSQARVAVLITGSGLKDPESTLRGHPTPTVISPDLPALEEHLQL
ncbi:MAG: threonine synthase [Candidatus Bipolaricaulota bacterium]